MKSIVTIGLAAMLAAATTGCVAPATTTTSTGAAQQTATTQDAVGAVLGSVLGSATTGGALGNILSGVIGSVTTTRQNLVGTWSYTEPAVQFESDNLLVKAGGAAAAARVESELTKYYKMVGIKPGAFAFTFNQDGTCQYTVGKKTLTGQWAFDTDNKVVTITTATGINVGAYVTISGSQMSMCFDSTKVLTLFTGVASQVSAISSIGQIAGQFSGMKTGFAFSK